MVAPKWEPACGRDLFVADGLQTDIVQGCASARNIAIKSIAHPTFFLTHQNQTRHFINHRPDTLSYFARQVSNSKALSKAFLRAAGLPIPQGRLFNHADFKLGWKYAQSLGSSVVVKPLTGSFGNGVTANIRSREHFRLAWEQSPSNKSVIVEGHIEGNDYRVIVIGQRHVATALRRPAWVMGDGVASIIELIKNKKFSRRSNPYVGEDGFELTPIMEFLLEQTGHTPDTVLPDGKPLQLHDIANVSAGGDAIDVTDLVHPDFEDIAVRAIHAIPGMIYGGVDILAPDISKPPHEQDFAICEVNTTPDLALHHFPMEGLSRDANGALIEHLFPLARLVPRQSWVPRSIEIAFSGRYEDFKKSLTTHVLQNSVSGTLKRSGEQSAEMCVAAPNVALRRFLRRITAIRGVKVVTSDWLGTPPEEFLFRD